MPAATRPLAKALDLASKSLKVKRAPSLKSAVLPPYLRAAYGSTSPSVSTMAASPIARRRRRSAGGMVGEAERKPQPQSAWTFAVPSIQHVAHHAVGELGLEPGGLGRHDAAGVGHRHQV